MTKTTSYFLIAGIIISLIIGSINYINTKNLQQALQQQELKLTKHKNFLDPIIEQEEMMQKLDSVKLEEGTNAPDFSLEDQNGNITNLASFTTPKTLLIFSSSQCSVCSEFYPDIQEFTQNQETIATAVIQLDANKDENLEMLQKNKYDFTLLAGNHDIFNLYKVTSTPTSVLINTATKKVIKTENPTTLQELQEFTK